MSRLQRISLLGLVLTAALPPVSLEAQAGFQFAIGVHTAKGEALSDMRAYIVEGAAILGPRISLYANVGHWTSQGLCIQIIPDSYRCTLGWNSAAAGFRAIPLSIRGFDLFASIGVGAFRHTDKAVQATDLAVPIQIGLRAPLTRVWRVVGSWQRVWISDEDTEVLLGERPRFTGFSLGFEWLFGGDG